MQCKWSLVLVFSCLVLTASASSDKKWKRLLKRLEDALHRESGYNDKGFGYQQKRYPDHHPPYKFNFLEKKSDRNLTPDEITGDSANATMQPNTTTTRPNNDTVNKNPVTTTVNPNPVTTTVNPNPVTTTLNPNPVTTTVNKNPATTLNPNPATTTVNMNPVTTTVNPNQNDTNNATSTIGNVDNRTVNRKIDWVDYTRRYQEYKCPTLDVVLPEFFKGFPHIADMSWSVNFNLEDLRGSIKKTLEVYNLQKNARLSLAPLMEDFARYVISKRMVCPASKFRQVIIYVIRSYFDNSLPYDYKRLVKNLQGVIDGSGLTGAPPVNDTFVRNVFITMYSEIFGEIVQPLQREEYRDVARLLDSFYVTVMERFQTTQAFPDENDLFGMMMSHKVTYTNAFKCTSEKELFQKIKGWISSFTVHFSKSTWLISRMEDIIKEQYMLHNNMATDSDLTNKMIKTILQTTDNTTVDFKYLIQMGLQSPENFQKMFKGQLDKSQRKVLEKIEKALEKNPKRIYTIDDLRMDIAGVLDGLKRYQSNRNNTKDYHELEIIIKNIRNIVNNIPPETPGPTGPYGPGPTAPPTGPYGPGPTAPPTGPYGPGPTAPPTGPYGSPPTGPPTSWPWPTGQPWPPVPQ